MSSRHLLVLIALAHLAGVGVLHAQPALPSTALRSALIALAALALALFFRPPPTPASGGAVAAPH